MKPLNKQFIEKLLFTYKFKSGEVLVLSMFVCLYIFFSVIVTISTNNNKHTCDIFHMQYNRENGKWGDIHVV